MRNSASDLQCQAALPPKEREGISEIGFSTPRMCIGIKGDAFAFFILRAKIRIMAAAALDFLDFSFVSHEIVGELSFNKAMCFYSNEGK